MLCFTIFITKKNRCFGRMMARCPAKLETLCCTAIVNNLNYHLNDLNQITCTAKDLILTLASRRLNALQNETLLSNLIHPYVEFITFNNCNYVTNNMIKTISICRKLRKLSMTNPGNISKEALSQLIPKIPKLEHLSITKCSIIDDDIVQLMSEYCKSLHTVNLENCNLADRSLNYLKNLPLKALNVSGMKFSDEAVKNFTLGSCSITLNELILTHCSNETNFLRMIMSMPKLNTFVNKGSVDYRRFNDVAHNDVRLFQTRIAW